MNEKTQAHPVTVPSGIDEDSIHQKTLTARDGVELYYEVVGDGDSTMVLANGLGARLYSWGPILRNFKDDFKFLTWDYRGLFESEAEQKIRRLGVVEHTEDLNELMETIGADSAVITGWSMGVQVALEFASLYPEKVDGLVLLNGSFGHIFDTAFQPVVPLPYTHGILHNIIEWSRDREELVGSLVNWVLDNIDFIVKFTMAVSPGSTNRDEMAKALEQYLTDIFGTDLKNYLRLFQELDSHSVYHKLPEIEAPSLIFSGGLDALTPTHDSRKMARRIPESRHVVLWLANHFAILEYPNKVVDEIDKFLTDYDLVPG